MRKIQEYSTKDNTKKNILTLKNAMNVIYLIEHSIYKHLK